MAKATNTLTRTVQHAGIEWNLTLAADGGDAHAVNEHEPFEWNGKRFVVNVRCDHDGEQWSTPTVRVSYWAPRGKRAETHRGTELKVPLDQRDKATAKDRKAIAADLAGLFTPITAEELHEAHGYVIKEAIAKARKNLAKAQADFDDPARLEAAAEAHVRAQQQLKRRTPPPLTPEEQVSVLVKGYRDRLVAVINWETNQLARCEGILTLHNARLDPQAEALAFELMGGKELHFLSQPLKMDAKSAIKAAKAAMK